jgi:hypothetical protein
MKWLASIKPANLITALLGVLSLVAGVALLLAAGGIVVSVVGIGLLGLSGIAFVALVFLLVGESEERDRLRHPRG